MSINTFDYNEKDGTSDVYFSISLREYRYVLPNSNKLNNTTGLASRVAEEQKEKVINWYPGMDLMDVAAQSVGQFFPIEEQDAKQLSVFRTLAKTKNLNVGTILHATKQSIKVSDDTIINFYGDSMLICKYTDPPLNTKRTARINSKRKIAMNLTLNHYLILILQIL